MAVCMLIRMKRRALKLIVFLILGAMINLAVAWGIAIAPLPQGSWMAVEGEPVIEASSLDWVGSEPIVTAMHRSCGRVHLSQEFKDYPGLFISLDGDWWITRIPRWSMIRPGGQAPMLGEKRGGHRVRECIESATGWPMLSFRCRDARSGDWANTRILESAGAFYIERQGIVSSYIALPWWPLWSGLALNTILYAALSWVIWLLLALPFSIRRRRRIKRGLCACCAYPTGPSDVCSECGASVRARAVQQDAADGSLGGQS